MPHKPHSFFTDPKDIKQLLGVEAWTHIEGKHFGQKVQNCVYVSANCSAFLNAALAHAAGWPWEQIFPHLAEMVAFLSGPESHWKNVPYQYLAQAHFVGDWMKDNIGIFDNGSKFRLDGRDKLLAFLNDFVVMPEDTQKLFWQKVIGLYHLDQSCWKITINEKDGTSLTYFEWEYLYCVLFKYAGSVLRDYTSEKAVDNGIWAAMQKLYNRLAKFIPKDCEPVILSGSLDSNRYFIHGDTFWQVRVLDNRPNINHFWSLYGDFTMGKVFGGNHREDDPSLPGRLAHIRTLGVVNPKKDDAYIIPLAGIPSGARLVMDDIVQQCK